MPVFLPFNTFYARVGHGLGMPESKLYNEDHSIAMYRYIQQVVDVNNSDTAHGTIMLASYMCDRAAYLSGRPYYKIWPEFVVPFCRTSLDVPVKYLRMPYAGWEIRLPLAEDGWSHPLAGCHISVSYASTAVDAAPAAISAVKLAHTLNGMRALKMDNFPMAMTILLVISQPESANAKCTPDGRGWLSFAATIPLMPDSTVEESLALAFNAFKVKEDVREMEQQCLRLVLTLSFLTTGSDKIIEPDVLSADLAKYIEAKKAEDIQRLHDKATRRRGEGVGYTVGRRERLLNIARQRNAEYEKGTGRPLKFQHQRGAHMHTYHTKEGIMMRWIPQLTVRPELPPDDSGGGRGSQVR